MPFLDAMTTGWINPLVATLRMEISDGGDTVETGWDLTVPWRPIKACVRSKTPPMADVRRGSFITSGQLSRHPVEAVSSSPRSTEQWHFRDCRRGCRHRHLSRPASLSLFRDRAGRPAYLEKTKLDCADYAILSRQKHHKNRYSHRNTLRDARPDQSDAQHPLRDRMVPHLSKGQTLKRHRSDEETGPGRPVFLSYDLETSTLP